jgi:hypothetical protein
MSFWLVYLILVHIAAALGICLTAWVTGVCIKNASRADPHENLPDGWQ